MHRLGSVVLVSTHAEVRAALLDSRRLINAPRTSESPSQLHDELLRFEIGYMSRRDGPDHARIRAAAQPAFAARHLAKLEAVTQRLTDELLDELRDQETPDLIELAYRLPLLVLTSMLGAPSDDAELLKGWGYELFAPRRMPVRPDVVQRASWALADYRAYVGELVTDRSRRSRSRIATTLLAAEEGGQLVRDELVATYALVLHAGHETTTNLIGNGLLALLTHKEQWRRLCADPSLAPRAVEEAFRYDAPVQASLRTAAVDLELAGMEIPAGTAVLLLIGAANRDRVAFPSPDEVDIARHPNAHLALAHGVHFCLGAPVARLQARIVLTTLARRFPGTELAAGPDTLPRTNDISMRGVVSLPVSLRI